MKESAGAAAYVQSDASCFLEQILKKKTVILLRCSCAASYNPDLPEKEYDPRVVSLSLLPAKKRSLPQAMCIVSTWVQGCLTARAKKRRVA